MSRRQKDDLLSWAMIIIIGAFVISAFQNHDLLKIALIASIVLMILSWLVAMELPTRCGVATRSGQPCRLSARGIIFGCKQYHFWEKARARTGKRRQVWQQSQLTAGPGQKGRNIGPQVVTVRIQDDLKSRVTFQCTMVTTLCTLVTTGLTVATAL